MAFTLSKDPIKFQLSKQYRYGLYSKPRSNKVKNLHSYKNMSITLSKDPTKLITT